MKKSNKIKLSSDILSNFTANLNKNKIFLNKTNFFGEIYTNFYSHQLYIENSLIIE